MGLDDETILQLNIPFKKPVEEKLTEIEVTDPTHPLFGRRFSLQPISSRPRVSAEHVFVSFDEFMTLRIPIAATNLAPPRPTSATKLTLEAITELISLAEQSEVLCLCKQATSGASSPPSCKPKSGRKSV
jgi:hypothetical protein